MIITKEKLQMADWKLAYLYVADKTAHPEGFILNHLYPEDLRKIIWLLGNEHAGFYDEPLGGYDPDSFPALTEYPYNGDVIFKWAGQWKVAIAYDEHGVKRTVVWANTADITIAECHLGMNPPYPPPPASIHYPISGASHIHTRPRMAGEGVQR